jgi:glycine dehydrogenase subunit 1
VEYAPHTDEDLAEMLAVLGLSSLDDLFEQIPEQVRAPADVDALGLPQPLAEAEVVEHLRALAARNTTVDDAVCWLGGGVYDHYVPALVGAVIGKPEFATAYTPYQPEMSQGVLQALFEFQTIVSEVLGLPVANASLYDGATALVEAMVLCVGSQPSRTKVVVGGTLDPRFREILATYAPGMGLDLVEVAPVDGVLPAADVAAAATDAAAVIVQHPNVLGLLEDVPGLAEAAHAAGARLVVSFDPLLAGVLEPPGRLGADVVTADALSVGNAMSFGGPGAGLLACRMQDVRRLPGRLVGETVDLAGKRGYVLTLQAREQHIRREKATSNICTNQSLNALAVAVYLAWLGPQGLRTLGETALAGAAAVEERLRAVGLPPAHGGGVFGKELAYRVPDPAAFVAELGSRGHLVGPVVSVAGEELVLVAVTEQRTAEQMDALARAVAEVLQDNGRTA